ncbi:hypothetical protein KS18_12410 [Photorhabdus luminescens]|nr:hypothetical protein KS18_12410 [Photorhabdus luminescens]
MEQVDVSINEYTRKDFFDDVFLNGFSSTRCSELLPADLPAANKQESQGRQVRDPQQTLGLHGKQIYDYGVQGCYIPQKEIYGEYNAL